MRRARRNNNWTQRSPHERSDMRERTTRQSPDFAALIRATILRIFRFQLFLSPHPEERGIAARLEGRGRALQACGHSRIKSGTGSSRAAPRPPQGRGMNACGGSACSSRTSCVEVLENLVQVGERELATTLIRCRGASKARRHRRRLRCLCAAQHQLLRFRRHRAHRHRCAAPLFRARLRQASPGPRGAKSEFYSERLLQSGSCAEV
jgi:hypothetical protein